jgi:hypothetical protein
MEVWYFEWSKKSGPVILSRFQESWVFGVGFGPENLDLLYFHVPRKSGGP